MKQINLKEEILRLIHPQDFTYDFVKHKRFNKRNSEVNGNSPEEIIQNMYSSLTFMEKSLYDEIEKKINSALNWYVKQKDNPDLQENIKKFIYFLNSISSFFPEVSFYLLLVYLYQKDKDFIRFFTGLAYNLFKVKEKLQDEILQGLISIVKFFVQILFNYKQKLIELPDKNLCIILAFLSKYGYKEFLDKIAEEVEIKGKHTKEDRLFFILNTARMMAWSNIVDVELPEFKYIPKINYKTLLEMRLQFPDGVEKKFDEIVSQRVIKRTEMLQDYIENIMLSGEEREFFPAEVIKQSVQLIETDERVNTIAIDYRREVIWVGIKNILLKVFFKGNELKFFQYNFDDTIRSLDIDEEKGILVIGLEFGEINVFDIEGERIILKYKPVAKIRFVKIDPDERDWIICGGEDSKYRISLMRYTTREHRYLKGGHKNFINDAIIKLREKRIYSCGNDGRIVRWNIETGKPVDIGEWENGIYTIVYDDKRKYIYAGEVRQKSYEGVWNRISRWKAMELKRGGVEIIPEAHRSTIRKMYLVGDNKFLITCSLDGTIGIWSLIKNEIMKRISIKDELKNVYKEIGDIAISESGDKILAGSSNGELHIFNLYNNFIDELDGLITEQIEKVSEAVKEAAVKEMTKKINRGDFDGLITQDIQSVKVLGQFYPDNNEVVLYPPGMEITGCILSVKRKKELRKVVYTSVLLHELGHWLSQYEIENGKIKKTSLYLLGESIEETMAQYYAYQTALYCNEEEISLYIKYDSLNSPEEYNIFKYLPLEEEHKEKVMGYFADIKKAIREKKPVKDLTYFVNILSKKIFEKMKVDKETKKNFKELIKIVTSLNIAKEKSKIKAGEIRKRLNELYTLLNKLRENEKFNEIYSKIFKREYPDEIDLKLLYFGSIARYGVRKIKYVL